MDPRAQHDHPALASSETSEGLRLSDPTSPSSDMNPNPAALIKLDPEYYRSTYPDLAQLNDEQLAEHWLTYGFYEGRRPSRDHVTQAANDLDVDFYYAFYPDLRAHGLSTPESLQDHYHRHGAAEDRLPNYVAWLNANELPEDLNPQHQSFRDIIQRNQKTGLHIDPDILLRVLQGQHALPVRLFDDDRASSKHYLHMARLFLAASRVEEARNLLHASLGLSASPTALELLGSTYLQQDHPSIALSYFDAASSFEDAPRWLHYNRAVCLARLSRHLEAVNTLAEGIASHPDFTLQLTKLDELAKAAWDDLNARLSGAVAIGIRGDREGLKSLAYAYAETIYSAYLRAVSTLQTLPKLASVNLSRILIVADFHVPQCVRYRVEQKVEQLEAIGIKVTTVDWTDLTNHQNAVATHDVVIFYRVPPVPLVLKAMAQVNGTGKLSIYEIDDLLFESSYPPPIETYGGYVALDVYRGLTRDMALFNTAARFCRLGIASTESLRAHLAKLVMSGECMLHRNGLDSLNEIRKPERVSKSTVDLFYGSGTMAHNSDFVELAWPAIRRVMAENHQVRLIVVGYLKVPQEDFGELAGRIIQLPPVNTIKSYWSLLEKADINLAVLHDDEINGAKSELKWFEAACVGLPSIVSDTANYRDVVKHGEDALIARTTEDWYRALTQLVAHPSRRAQIAEAALARVSQEYSVTTLGKTLVNQIQEATRRHQRPSEDAERSAEHSKKCKVAIVNVFFPPQAIGGATRVVADNVMALGSLHAKDLEICIFSADSEQRPSHQMSVYDFMGSRVYRVTTPHREHMDWHARDSKMYGLFADFLELEQPDVVHFHCVQRLTGSVVEAARDARIPYLVTVHDAWWISDFQFLVDHKGRVYPNGHPDPYALTELPEGITASQSIERKHYLKDLLQGAAKVLTVSEAFAAIHRDNGLPNIEVVSNGVSDKMMWAPKDTSFTRKVVGAHIGGMDHHKGYFLLKEAVLEAQPENMEFLIVDHSKAEDFESKLKWGKVGVTCIGRVSQTRMADLYRRIDVLFAPSTWPESFGLATREASACRCWVVASTMGGIGEHVIPDESGILVEPTKSSLVSAIRRIDQQHEHFKQLASSVDIPVASEQARTLAGYYLGCQEC